MKGKIVNDPIYGFLRFPEKEILQIIDHPWFQRLRRIKQMGVAHYVYPGAVHTRFHHSLGAAHLMKVALNELKIKEVSISNEDCVSAQKAILLHDIGHGPFSHSLEYSLIPDMTHEEISRKIMFSMNEEFGGNLTDAISIFDQKHPHQFLHQLVSSQLDMDRMDYLNRDSFYTGVSEGVIGYDRILHMLTVKDNALVVEEKGIHSVEKFIIARRLMYWQVYLHKTVLGAEQLIVNILKRAKELARKGSVLFATPAFKFFLYEEVTKYDFDSNAQLLSLFCRLDDDDIMTSIKVWTTHEDFVLSSLCTMLVNRELYKVKLSSSTLDEDYLHAKEKILNKLPHLEDDLSYFLFIGTTSNNTYDQNDEQIKILFKSGEVKAISEVDNALINELTSMLVEKHFICSIPMESLF